MRIMEVEVGNEPHKGSSSSKQRGKQDAKVKRLVAAAFAKECNSALQLPPNQQRRVQQS